VIIVGSLAARADRRRHLELDDPVRRAAPAGLTTVLSGIAGAIAGIAAPLTPPSRNSGAARQLEDRREGAR
jgi:hypothetical protein